MDAFRLLIIEDHAVVRAGLRLLLQAHHDIELVGEAGTAAEGLALSEQTPPDIGLRDLTFGVGGGFDVFGELKGKAPHARVVVLTMHEDPEYLRAALAAGAAAYVLKRSADTDLLSAIRKVAHGNLFVDAHLTHVLVNDLVGRSSPREAAAGTSEQLSERETQVARLLAVGYTNKEIAETLHLSVKTVETYRARVLRKLDVSSRAELVRVALREGWLDDFTDPPQQKGPRA